MPKPLTALIEIDYTAADGCEKMNDPKSETAMAAREHAGMTERALRKLLELNPAMQDFSYGADNNWQLKKSDGMGTRRYEVQAKFIPHIVCALRELKTGYLRVLGVIHRGVESQESKTVPNEKDTLEQVPLELRRGMDGASESAA